MRKTLARRARPRLCGGRNPAREVSHASDPGNRRQRPRRQQHLPPARPARRARTRDDARHRRSGAARRASTSRSCTATSCDPDAVARAVDGCGRVYHAAAGFLMWAQDPEHEIIRPSVDGTRNVMKAAAKAGVDKVLYVSTGGTIGFASTPGRRRATRPTTTRSRTRRTSSARSPPRRRRSRSASARSVAVTAINPGLILGPRFWKPSESIRQVLDFLNKRHADLLRRRLRRGRRRGRRHGRGPRHGQGRRSGERYILSGENVTVKQLFELVAELAGISAPTWKLPVVVLRAIATGLEAVSWVTGWRPLLDRNQVDEFAGALRATSIPARPSATSASRGATPATRSAARWPGPSTAASSPTPGAPRCVPIPRCPPTDSDGAEPLRVRVPRGPVPDLPLAPRPRAALPQRRACDFWALSRFRDVLGAFVDWETYSSVGGLILESSTRRISRSRR